MSVSKKAAGTTRHKVSSKTGRYDRGMSSSVTIVSSSFLKELDDPNREPRSSPGLVEAARNWRQDLAGL